ncbi:DUF2158 domain-containing protein [Mesorhizobium sp.]|uniref:YodC family protein n=1 Tax=Mesorhizobium sp. TaxID=1871066 RepID=UPI000FE4C1B9|nr:DUF2158 domain-containing protein [Mesorhizobium sp.]RWH32208.1 MAG: DUF2158 domain-containing protein [Mesorhizobium sp.]RWH40834.1 MAG: DUF2158 domain-containing protein [Mesorhizobium sp.]TIM64443.1 MAG: DUF2158 domain-containing protein [Mesorhizobium sp.]TIR61457.1 MAG: DUF2158 domain-containing protein [Mesorhizobium sp.]TIR70649.1 MAG: DUF2158 domain-containing protein [Mesorhizobium sp.]
MAYKVGDVVVLKSGGPKMTITESGGGDRVGAMWFAGAKREHGTFPVDAIEAATDPKKK